MRRALVFLLVFALGFALLWKLSGGFELGRTREPAPAPPPQGEFTEVPLQPLPPPEETAPLGPEPLPAGQEPVPETQRRALGVLLDGPLALTIRKATTAGVERPEIELRAQDVDSLGGDEYDLKELEVEVFDPERGVLRARIESPLARTRILMGATGTSRAELQSARFTDVTLTLVEGAPIVPLRFRAPALEWDVAAFGFTSTEHVRADGEGFAAEGTGLRAGYGASQLVLERQATTRLTLAGGDTAALSSGPQGALVVRRVDRDGTAFVDVTAEDGARLEVAGKDPFTLDARTIHLVGRMPAGGSQSYELVSADAQGDVVATSRGDEFRAQRAELAFAPGGRLQRADLFEDVVLRSGPDSFRARDATFEFGADGRLARATLVGEPEGDLGIARHLAGRRPEVAPERAHIRGAGPLVVELQDGVAVDLAGPARVDVIEPELTLTAEGRVHGRVAPDRQAGFLAAGGAAALDAGCERLESDALELSWTLDASAVPALTLVSPGVTAVRGVTRLGNELALDAEEGLTARWSADRLIVPEARAVSLTVGGAEATSARARLVQDLDWDARTFTASGDVAFRGQDGHGVAQRAIVRGERDVEMIGAHGSRAAYALQRAADAPRGDLDVQVRALGIRATERRVQARGEAQVEAEVGAESLDLAADSIDVQAAPQLPGSLAMRPFEALAEGAVRAHVERPGESADVEADWLRFDGRIEPPVAPETEPRVVPSTVEARGAVHVAYAGRGELDAHADRFTLDELGNGRLSAGAGRRVTAIGRMQGMLAPYRVEADWIDVEGDALRASRVEARLVDSDAPAARATLLRELRARSLRADRGEVLLEGEARVLGATDQGEDWSLEAGSIRLQGDFRDASELRTEDVQNLLAEGGFVASMGAGGIARGERMEGVPGRLRLEGAPAELLLLDAQWRAPWIEYDTTNMLIATDRGEITSRPGAPGTSWALEYDSLQPFDQGETTILVLRNPRIRYGAMQVIAEWTLFWVDREEWRRNTQKAVRENLGPGELRVTTPDEPPPAGTQTDPTNPLERKLSELRKEPFFRLLSEIYVEGNIEYFDVGERLMRAEELYLDLIEVHGWLRGADVRADIDVHGEPRPVRAKAEWMRISSGPTFRADTAVLTSCDYDDPHYVIETQDLRLTPQANEIDDRVAFQVSAEGNAIRFEGGITLPLPPLVFETTKEGSPLIDRFVMGNSAKFGAAIGASINAQLGVIGLAVGKLARFALDLPDVPITGGWNFDVRYLGSRGLLLGTGLDLRIGDRFWLDAAFDVIPDEGADRGLVRVDEDDREILRTWLHARGRYVIDRGPDGQWVDLALSKQSDPGVQAEFFEKRFLNYEEKDNYVHWRKADGSDYYSGSVKVLLENRTDVEELPSLGAFRGRAKIGELWGQDLLHTGTLDAAYLRRKDGDPRYYEPFPDGLGDREVLRADTRQRLELPLPVGLWNARATPFVEGRATAWDQGVDEDESPARAALLAGIEATTTLWRVSSKGTAHTLSPTIAVRGDLADFESGGDPVRFDATEDPFLGRFVDLGLRARWWRPEAKDRFDTEVRASWGQDVEGPTPDGLQPIAALAEYYTFLGGFPFAVTHDGRYDVEETDTIYSRTLVGFEPMRNVGIELGYHFGRDELGGALYEAASAVLRWRWTTKWEIEIEQTRSLADERNLGADMTLRRLGHDFVFEIEGGYVAGEGSRFGIGFEPRLSWRRSSLGLIDQWLGIYH